MTHRLFWKLCLIVAIGTVALFYLLNILSARTEEQMSYLAAEHQQELRAYAQRAQELYAAGDKEALRVWMADVQQREATWAAVVEAELTSVAGGELGDYFYEYYGIGRGIQYILHPWHTNPLMELDFPDSNVHFLIRLPERMRPGLFRYLGVTNVALQIILPLIVLSAISLMLYQHIMSPLRKLEVATREFSRGRLDVRLQEMMGNRSDELTELAETFDKMAARISDLILGQRQLIADLSHELRTPLARLDVAIDALKNDPENQASIKRVSKESAQIRKLMEDTLTLAWLENENPSLTEENLDLVDLMDVLVEDAGFEFPDRELVTRLPDSAVIKKSNHRAVGQAVENVLRNALRHTPPGKQVKVELDDLGTHCEIHISDQGPGVPESQLNCIFQPFYRVDSSRSSLSGFGLGLALAKRHLEAVAGTISARNMQPSGLHMKLVLPK